MQERQEENQVEDEERGRRGKGKRGHTDFKTELSKNKELKEKAKK